MRSSSSRSTTIRRSRSSCSEWTLEGRALRYTDTISGHSLFVSRSHPAADASLRFAQRLGRRLRDAGLVPTLHHAADIDGERRELIDAALGIHRFDELAVLRTATMPALLLEAGRDRQPQRRARAWQAMRGGARIADAIVGAVVEQCENEPR